ncbi:MAG: hypothetical protein ABSH20_25275 [Tepidisphaeraceae bacterium]
MMHRIAFIVLCCTIIAWPRLLTAQTPAETATPNPGEAATILDTAQRLIGEEQRQMEVGQQLDGSAKRAAELVDDLKSNNLFKETRGDRFVLVGKTLTDVNSQNVPEATRYLKSAREEMANLGQHLTGADREIGVAIKRLQSLLDRSAILDELIAALKVIIQRQTVVRATTAEWGQQVVNKVADIEARAGELSRNQKELADRIKEFDVRLSGAADAETAAQLKDRMTRARNVMADKKVNDLAAAAAGEIEHIKPVGAIDRQDQTLAILNEVLKILLESDQTSQQAFSLEQIRELQNLAQAERQLAQQIEQANPQQFQQQAPDLQNQQVQLRKQVQEIQKSVQSQNLQNAQQDMARAEQHMEKTEQQDAQKAAEDAADELARAADDAQQQDQQANQPEQGTPEPHQPGDKMVVLPPQPGPRLEPPTQITPINTEGERLFASSNEVKTPNSTAGRSQIKPLANRERDQLMENYARELPVEYRALLKEYYESLAK